MTYQETLDYLFNALPMYQRIGAVAYKTDLTNTIALCQHLGDPQTKFKSIHVAGTNGKGSTSHSIAAILQEAGYKVGLYTSPHLKSFTERIKINGAEIPEDAVVTFVEKHKNFLEDLMPSFFEMTVGMAFEHFAKEKVDYAVIEVGLGGRLDSTNVITPEICVITNIGLDHTQFLGDTLPKIAAEKAGIIKERVPVVISELQPATLKVFIQKADEKHAPIFFAEEYYNVQFKEVDEEGKAVFIANGAPIKFDLTGKYQQKNLGGILKAIDVLKENGLKISAENISNGLLKTVSLTGLKGRWQKINNQPLTYCDTGHNSEGFEYILKQIEETPHEKLFMVLGMVNDKDISKVLSMMPKDAEYIFCQANIPRALPASDLYEAASKMGLRGEIIPDVNQAIAEVLKKAGKNDFIFVGGSTFVVAEIENL
ncbi:bifunctional folylpolyglutamate synthase/dihydrofolate synthase [Litoribacter alkaliphilus]|uniref:Dihydrofolate synthase/folylpolyglutamate synthase n=1 Tax=Litoribacter ruber TaxID=702568 RepID=A0AAP2G1Q9_9BACT|nr:folylpolyglutamate synthase/dihydrofolate synthase family protein [Litoribacter alkaliphilus]MBS9524587.1 bifunctional folylpolyglutamate synthase/dihydrofolate synthase [Litoribacter alkaliphilus]